MRKPIIWDINLDNRFLNKQSKYLFSFFKFYDYKTMNSFFEKLKKNGLLKTKLTINKFLPKEIKTTKMFIIEFDRNHKIYSLIPISNYFELKKNAFSEGDAQIYKMFYYTQENKFQNDIATWTAEEKLKWKHTLKYIESIKYRPTKETIVFTTTDEFIHVLSVIQYFELFDTLSPASEFVKQITKV